MIKEIVCFSGGLDSTVLLSDLVVEYEPSSILAVSFCYGSKHNKHESDAAEKICSYYGISRKIIDLTNIFNSVRSSLMLGGSELPEGHFEEESMKQTIVPGRNIVFISVLSSLAWSLGSKRIWAGFHQGDRAIYPDCRLEFVKSMNQSLSFGTEGNVSLVCPLINLNKAEIVERGLKNEAPLGLTRTCYSENKEFCGKCGACVERRWAFDVLGEDDPLI